MLCKVLRGTAGLAYKSSRNFSKSHKLETTERNDATSVFLQSVTSTLRGITHVNYVVEHDPNLTAEEKAQRKQFLIYRYNPAVTPPLFLRNSC